MNNLLAFFVLFFSCLVLSTCMYIYLHRKTRMRVVFLWIDNIIVGMVSGILTVLLYQLFEGVFFRPLYTLFIALFCGGILVVAMGFAMTMFRFWRTPKRKVNAVRGELVSPADGNVLYVRKVESGEIPVSIKNGLEAGLNEIIQTDIIKGGMWLIGINMTPFDVHKNTVPASGTVILNKHIPGNFFSLKLPDAILRNERNTLIIRTDENELLGVVQTASKMVRRIDTYVCEGDRVEQGQWFGMIRFGSQVDLIIPDYYNVLVKPGEQVYAVKTIIARK